MISKTIMAAASMIAVSSCGQATTEGGNVAQSADSAADERAIKGLQQEWMDAWVQQDRAKIETILAPDYTLTVSSMPSRPITREQWIGMLPRYTAKGFEYRDMRVRAFGDVAVVSSIGQAIGAQVDGADRSFPFFLTDVWTKRDGRWQVSARYSSMPEQGTESSKAMQK